MDTPAQRPSLASPALAVTMVIFVALVMGVAIGLGGTRFTGLLVALALLLALPFLAWRLTRRLIDDDRSTALIALLLWILTFNIPVFMDFDSSGLQKPELINPQSMARIACFFAVGAVFVGVWMLRGVRPGASRLLWPAFALPTTLYAWYAIDAPLVSRGSDLLLALFRASEWILALLLAWAALGNLSASRRLSMDAVLKLVYPLVLFPIVVAAVLFVAAPSVSYRTSDITGIGRLAGPLTTHPVVLGTLCSMAVFYIAGFWRGWKRAVTVGVLLGMLILTYSRGPIAGFAIALVVYALLGSRSASTRAYFLLFTTIVTLAIAGSEDVLETLRLVLQRGQTSSNLWTLSERTIVWEAAQILIGQSPWLGSGFVAGPKHLADVMAGMSIGAYFVAPTAHNELLQAWISGGVPALLLSVAIQLRSFWLCFRLRRRIPDSHFTTMLGWLTLLTVYSFLQPTLSISVNPMGVIPVLLYVSLEVEARRLARSPAADLPSRGGAQFRTG